MGPSSDNTEARGWTRGHPDFMIHLKMEEKCPRAELAEISHVTDWSCDWHSCWPLTGKRNRRFGSEKCPFLCSWTGILECEERVDEWLVGTNTVCQVLPALMVSRTPHCGQAFQMIASLLRASVPWRKPPVNWTRSYRWNLRNGSAHGVWSQPVQVLPSVYANKGWVQTAGISSRTTKASPLV